MILDITGGRSSLDTSTVSPGTSPTTIIPPGETTQSPTIELITIPKATDAGVTTDTITVITTDGPETTESATVVTSTEVDENNTATTENPPKTTMTTDSMITSAINSNLTTGKENVSIQKWSEKC